jgi:uncharacterized membrane protein (DUF2068 family)
MNSSHAGLIRLIALFKFVKTAALIVTGVGVLKLIHSDIAGQLDHWVARLGFDPGSRYINEAIEKATNLPPHRIKEMGLACFFYAPLFLTEGIGLWLLKRWAEWFTVVITGSLVPVEIYEIFRHPSAIKVLVLVINLAVVAYLLYRIVQEPRPIRNAKEARM